MSSPSIRSSLVTALIAAALPGARAADVAMTVTSPGGVNGTVYSTQGWSFTPSKNLLVSQLGVYDVYGDGLGQAHAVGLWTSGGSLLASATVPAGTGSMMIAGTRFVDITGTLLSKGQTYVIGAYYLDGTDGILVNTYNGNVFAYDPKVTSGTGRAAINQFSGLGFPDLSPAGERLGPNFMFTVAADRTWPTGAAPCNDINSLAACINGADPGDIIEIAANAIPAQSVEVTTVKSFILRPASGFTPTFGGFTNFFVPGGNANVTIEGLTLASGNISVGGGGGSLYITLRHLHIQQASTYLPPLEVYNRSGATVFNINDNQIEINVGASDYVSAISVWGLDSASGSISRNRILQVGGGQNAAIEIANGDGTVSADLIGNKVAGTNFNSGISLYEYGSGAITARVINNIVSGQINYAGSPAAISLNVSGTGGHGDFTVLNNTVANNDDGILLVGRPDLGATATAVVGNNIVAFNNVQGLSLQDFPAENSFNLVHGNASDYYTPGPGDLTSDPLFIDDVDFQLVGGSPAENSGYNGLIPADIVTDISGNPRILGIVDRGAYELAAGGSDQDNDYVADLADNCVLVYNWDQYDADHDGYGNICDGDLNNSGRVTVVDYTIFRNALNSTDPVADLNGSGRVTVVDYTILRNRLNTVPGPSGYHP